MRDAAGHLTLTTIGDAGHALDPATVPSLFQDLDAFETGSQPGAVINVRRDVLKRLRALGYIR
jgi:hypothetical protein